ncbi:hypothetical protein CJD36_005050 [Flavipsychrobacter stenotrophus]|uniref:Uncharacterized protein n=1 Tax=Flavipsychrobacter stenotrophus TaxID=2077091 RepID=A0A2S7T1L6_9BACT|nr:hypothetical protein [Flavipsychrobacter stenotrophus]PQJ13112.1 hypothetical protein CJD36_005050 [Flavipsychrobacter stenotrophus]
MEIALYIVLAISQVGLLVYYFLYNRRKKQKESERRSALTKEFPYETLRGIALNTNPGAMLATIPQGETAVYSAVMDWDMGNDIVTLITTITGEATLYVKSGGGIIGSGKYPSVSSAAQHFTSATQAHLSHATPVTNAPLPQRNCVQFFLLTNNGKFSGTDLLTNIENKTSLWLPLFEEANKVIAEMRATATV